MANQLIIKGPVKINGEVVSTNVQNTGYTLPDSIGTEGQVLTVVSGELVWTSAVADNDGIIGPSIYSYNTASPVTLYTGPATSMLVAVSVEIITPFSDPLATLAVVNSLNSDVIVSEAETDLSADTGQIFRSVPGYVFSMDTPVYLAISPEGSTSGSFKITLTYMQ